MFTNKEGKYQFHVPSGNPITVCFDTHYPLKNNTRKWHPSVVANIDTDQDILLNRFLMEVGESKGWTFNNDALTAYQFILMWSEKTSLDKALAEYNSFRVSQLMFVQPEFIDIQIKLIEYFKRKSNCD
ncbi:hypothetical protein [Bacillus cereus]|uniref:hypothetical protein n=1 Tax=Bacillus cereus TaxID=1396 RepID=UPI0018F2BCBE|nr:hypothetical protein [Bacillus cereus]